MEHIELNEKETGINCINHTYMVAGWLSDYKLTYDEDILGELGRDKKTLTVNDFKENRGYVDEEGNIYIFREHPNPNELIPWFTIEVDTNGKPKLVFNQRRSEETRKMFRIERVGNLTVKSIIDKTTEGEVEYDAEVLNDIMRATSTFIPEIKDGDDFLKKIIKTSILEKNVNVHKYKKCMEKSYQLSNLIQALSNKTKISPFVFETWMEILGCDFEIKVMDNGSDRQDPLPYTVRYKSMTGEIIVDREGEENAKEKVHVSRSARQFN